MQRVKQIQQQLSDVHLLQELTSTFESIAAQNLAATRNKVLAARAFLEEAQAVYTDARDIFINQHHLAEHKLQYHEQLLIRPDNGKHLSVIISPNTKLYGALPDQLLNTVVEEIRKEPRDVLVLGKVGVEYFERLKPPIPFKSLPIADEDFTVEQVTAILHFVSQYHRVSAFYNHFRTVLTADVLEAELKLTAAPEESSQLTVDSSQQKDGKPLAVSSQPSQKELPKNFIAKLLNRMNEPDALFEPSLEEVLNFFETTILKTILRQKVHESLLSRYAARMVAMDVATENAKKENRRLQQELRRAKRQQTNAKLLDSYSGMSMWKS